uniref:Uncharacterized protein n=1 Tax=Anopheles maculatus TaxID=74869 RepID=A0A182T082_9DIPT
MKYVIHCSTAISVLTRPKDHSPPRRQQPAWTRSCSTQTRKIWPVCHRAVSHSSTSRKGRSARSSRRTIRIRFSRRAKKPNPNRRSRVRAFRSTRRRTGSTRMRTASASSGNTFRSTKVTAHPSTRHS